MEALPSSVEKDASSPTKFKFNSTFIRHNGVEVILPISSSFQRCSLLDITCFCSQLLRYFYLYPNQKAAVPDEVHGL